MGLKFYNPRHRPYLEKVLNAWELSKQDGELRFISWKSGNIITRAWGHCVFVTGTTAGHWNTDSATGKRLIELEQTLDRMLKQREEKASVPE